MLEYITLISLNDLADTPHNAWLRVFASKRKEHEKAFRHLGAIQLSETQLELHWLIRGLWKLIFGFTGEEFMKTEKTPEDVIAIGKWLEGTELEKSMLRIRLNELTPEERLEGLEPEERLKGLDPETIAAYLEKVQGNK